MLQSAEYWKDAAKYILKEKGDGDRKKHEVWMADQQVINHTENALWTVVTELITAYKKMLLLEIDYPFRDNPPYSEKVKNKLDFIRSTLNEKYKMAFDRILNEPLDC